jgi:GTPase SAR1 family protein
MDITSVGQSLDPITLGVGTELIAHVIAEGVGKVYKGVFGQQRSTVEEARILRQRRTEQRPDATLVRSCEIGAAEVARQLVEVPKLGIDDIRKLLVSPEVVSLIRQLYATELLNQPDAFELVQQRFDRILQLTLPIAREKQKQLASVLFAALVSEVTSSLSVQVELGSIAAHEALDAHRARILRDELEAVKKSIVALRPHRRASIRQILSFEEKYRELVGTRNSVITPPHLNQAPRIPIDDLYVMPQFIAPDNDEQDEEHRLGIDGLVATAQRIVVLGNPGGGKSTFAAKLCSDLTTTNQENWFGGRSVTPILVVLREYAAENKERKVSILEFIETQARASYQITPPEGAFEYLLLNGRAVVIFDGLDELLETRQRQRVTTEVESFCRLYPSAPIVVTSREVGYEQAPLNAKMFSVYRLAAFDINQVKEYAEKWFAFDAGGRSVSTDSKASAFFVDSESVPDLRSNPLMLGLMCTIYREEHYIPRNRPDVYRKCAEMMFDRWDRKREIPVHFAFESEFRPAVAFLAFWIYSEEALQAGVTERQLVHQASSYLLTKRFEDRDEAEEVAREFVEFCRGRAWVFTNTGSTGSGEELYQFTHRTFLEYFTALYLTRTHETADSLAKALIPKITRREWDVVAQLAFQIKNVELEAASDRLLHTVLEASLTATEQDAWNLLSFVARCLEFLVPSPVFCRGIADSCVTEAVEWVVSHSTAHRDSSADTPVKEILSALVFAASENRSVVTGGVRDAIARAIKKGDAEYQIAALDIGLHITSALHVRRNGIPSPPGADEHFSRFEREIADQWRDVMLELSKDEFLIAHDAFIHGIISAPELVERHGWVSFSPSRPYSAYSGVSRLPLAVLLVRSAWDRKWREWMRPADSLEDTLAWIGNEYLIRGDRLVFARADGAGVSWTLAGIRDLASEETSPPIGGDALFGAFYLMGALAEAVAGSGAANPIARTTLLNTSLDPVFAERFGLESEITWDRLRSEWDAERLEVAERWARGEVNFTNPPKSRPNTSKK